MDKAARARQLARCVAHTGDVFVFKASDIPEPVNWPANPSGETVPSQAPLSAIDLPQMIRLVGARAAFAAPAREPRTGEDLTDQDGNFYRIVGKPGEPTNPLLTLVCVTSQD